MKKKMVGIVVTMVTVGMCLGTTMVKAQEDLNVTYFISHTENEFNSTLADAMKTAADEKGITLTIVSADKDPAKQVSQIDNALVSGEMDGAIIQATSAEGVTAGITALKDEKIPTITLHEAVAAQDDAGAYVGPDLATIGLIVMEHVCEELEGEGNIAILEGVMGNSVQQTIAASYDEILEKYPDINVVFRDNADWETDAALSKVENWLTTGKKIDTIVCMNDSMAIGAMQAVNSADKTGEIQIYGSDATDQAIDAVRKGEMTGTVYFDVEDEGAAAIDTIYKMCKGEKVENEVLMPPTLIIAENISEFFPES